MAEQRFQGKCWLSMEGRAHMEHCFDCFSPQIRAAMASSVFNLCPACVADEAILIVGHSIQPRDVDVHTGIRAVANLEHKISAEIGTAIVYGPDHPQAQ